VIVASIRGIFCIATLAGLAACNNDGTSSGTTMPTAAEQPHGPGTIANVPPVTDPVEPATPPSTSHSSNDTPPPADEPAAPPVADEPTEPVDPPQDANSAPQISGSPAREVTVGQAFNFTPSASDADGDALTFSIQSKPSWASFDASSGRLW